MSFPTQTGSCSLSRVALVIMEPGTQVGTLPPKSSMEGGIPLRAGLDPV